MPAAVISEDFDYSASISWMEIRENLPFVDPENLSSQDVLEVLLHLLGQKPGFLERGHEMNNKKTAWINAFLLRLHRPSITMEWKPSSWRSSDPVLTGWQIYVQSLKQHQRRHPSRFSPSFQDLIYGVLHRFLKRNSDRPLIASEPPTLPRLLRLRDIVGVKPLRIIKFLTDLNCSIQRNLRPNIGITFLTA